MFDDIEACKETEKPFWETHESNKCPVNSKVPELPWDPAFSSVFNDFHIYIYVYMGIWVSLKMMYSPK